MSASAFDLDRFVQAQAAVYQSVSAELQAGKKTSHWMWFIFPQLGALGRSGTARFYGLANAQEARAYWAHPVLGARLKECAGRVLAVSGRTAHEIFGSPDDLKLCSCMTLFEAAVPQEPVFGEVLQRFYAGSRDVLTVALLRRAG
jgi:uncharacterized protein (DUF1810 family)